MPQFINTLKSTIMCWDAEGNIYDKEHMVKWSNLLPTENKVIANKSNIEYTMFQAMKYFSIKLHSNQQQFMGLFSCYLKRKHIREYMHQDGSKISTSETSQHSTNLDHRLLSYSSPAKRRVVLAAEGFTMERLQGVVVDDIWCHKVIYIRVLCSCSCLDQVFLLVYRHVHHHYLLYLS